MDVITTETHVMVCSDDGCPIVENDKVLFQVINDETYIYATPISRIQREFGITIVEHNSEDLVAVAPRNENNAIEGNNTVLAESEKFVWQHNSTLLLLDEYKKRIEKFRNPKIKKKTLWEEIAQIMKSNKYDVDADTLDRKFRNMKNTYRTILDNNNKKKSTGKGRIQWEYFHVLQTILQEDKTVHPTPVMSSTQPSTTVKEHIIRSAAASPILPFNVENLAVPPMSPSSSCDNSSTSDLSGTPTNRQKKAKAKQLEQFRKRQLEIEEEKAAELKKIRECVEENNKIRREKVELLKTMMQLPKE